MDGHLVPASSNSKICRSLENFTLDAERWLAALYWCLRTSYGDDAAHAAADCWLRVFEERLEGSSGLPELTRITAAAIAFFISNHRQAVYCIHSGKAILSRAHAG
jgi:hypothetical protein